MPGTSIHYANDRKERFSFIHEKIGVGVVTDTFIIDRGHANGAEIHSVTDNAIILIHNAKTKSLITELIARPEQLRRLYKTAGRKPPRKLLELAYKHNVEKYNII